MKRLKRIVLKIPFDPRYQDFLNLLTKYEVLQIHRLDEELIYVTQKLRFKNNEITPKDFEGKFGIEFIEILTKDEKKNEYICFAKHRWNKELQSFFSHSEIIIQPPIIMEDNSLIITFISNNKTIDIILNQNEILFESNFKILSISSVLPNEENLNLILTERQKEIIYYAVEKGYYEIPRKIDSNTLANHFEISKSAFCEHIRKIERTIFNSIFK
ncbi:MAG: hypothetical protein EU549_05055 [Promethearchaeota archaeon]|nr:MAG: hypothetical protein EU549_05055 [Candidatus Lokiarchaeota archaeon]